MKRTTALDKKIGKKIRQKRIENCLTQKELADLLGLTFQQIQKYEQGTNRVSAVRLFELAQIFKVSTEYFFEDEQDSDNMFFGRNPQKTKALLQIAKIFKNLEDENIQHVLRIIKSIVKMS